MKICPVCLKPVEKSSDLVVDWHSECYTDEAWETKVLPLVIAAMEKQQADSRAAMLKLAIAETMLHDREAIKDAAVFQKAVARNFNRMMGIQTN
jgi:hypothetical protein